MRLPISSFAWVLVGLCLSSCSIVSKDKIDGFAKLDSWKKTADSVHAKRDSAVMSDYKAASKAVRSAIAVKEQEAIAVGDAWLPLGAVDGSTAGIEKASPGVSGLVQKVELHDAGQRSSAAAADGTATVILEILKFIREQGVAGRQEEAKRLRERLNSYIWKEW